MKTSRTIKFPIEYTTLVIPHYAVEDYTGFLLKLMEAGIIRTDPYELENEEVFEIKLKENQDFSQQQWNQFLKMIQEDCTEFSFIYSTKVPS